MAEDAYFSVYFTVAINGVPLDRARMNAINSVSIEENYFGSDSCSIVVVDPEFLFIEDNIFIEEAAITVVMGVVGSTVQQVFNGYISALDLSFPEDGSPTLSLFCLDWTHLMNRVKKSRTWSNVTRADVVQKIAKEYGFSCSVQSGYEGTVEESIAQSEQTDIEFIEELASEEDGLFYCKLVGTEIQYKKMGLNNPAVDTLGYKCYPWDILSFSPQITKEDVPTQVIESDISTDTKVAESSTADAGDVQDDVQGEAVETVETPLQPKHEYNPETGVWETTY